MKEVKMECPAWLRAKRCGQLALGLGLDEAKIPVLTTLSGRWP